jgi:tripartite-type tricarboxylate transporter receptor subunit TctC
MSGILRRFCASNRVNASNSIKFVVAAMLPLCVLAGPAFAQTFPSRPVRLVIPFATGGSNDLIARALAEQLRKPLGQAVIIDNKGGAGGTVGTEMVARAPADGYTLLFVSASLTTNVAIKKSLPYDPVKDFAPVGTVGASPFVVVTSNRLPAASFAEFLKYARAHPGQLNYGSAGVGGISHLGTELLARQAGIEMTHVPYKGMAPALADIMGGQVQMALPSLPSVAGQIKSGTMRGLAVTSLKRSPFAPDLPTADEAGLPGYVLEIWWGIVAPAATPRPLIARLNGAINDALRTPEMQESLAREGAEPRRDTPESFGTLIREELARWDKLIRDARIPKE